MMIVIALFTLLGLAQLRPVEAQGSIIAVELSRTGARVAIDIGEAKFNDLFAMCPVMMYVRNGAVHSVYKRLSLDVSFNAYENFANMWSSEDNVIHEDFEMYSSLEDMNAGTGAWQFCNYDDEGIGYPRDCGPEKAQPNQWFTMPHGKFTKPRGLNGGASLHLFNACPLDSSYEKVVEFDIWGELGGEVVEIRDSNGRFQKHTLTNQKKSLFASTEVFVITFINDMVFDDMSNRKVHFDASDKTPVQIVEKTQWKTLRCGEKKADNRCFQIETGIFDANGAYTITRTDDTSQCLPKMPSWEDTVNNHAVDFDEEHRFLFTNNSGITATDKVRLDVRYSEWAQNPVFKTDPAAGSESSAEIFINGWTMHQPNVCWKNAFQEVDFEGLKQMVGGKFHVENHLIHINLDMKYDFIQQIVDPWGEPMDNLVTHEADLPFVLDVPCYREVNFGFEAYIEMRPPTGSPSKSPTTVEPTLFPTTDCPTVMPSVSPSTEEPTYHPSTDSPTEYPSVSPSTDSPTEYPTKNPTTEEPTYNPTTDQPTKFPTTEQPTLYPSNTPTTEEPTYHPSTDSPTEYPSLSPSSDMPTKFPSVIPSTSPSKSPSTNIPSRFPSRTPTFEPTRPPSIPPTYMPTRDPTFQPTTDPTIPPTMDPTLNPTYDERFWVLQEAIAEELTYDNKVVIQFTFQTRCKYPYSTEVRSVYGRDVVKQTSNVTESECVLDTESQRKRAAWENCQQWSVSFDTVNTCDGSRREVLVDFVTVHVHNNQRKEEKQNAVFALEIGTSSSWNCAQALTNANGEANFALVIETQKRLYRKDDTIEDWDRNYVLIMDRRVDVLFEFQSTQRKIERVRLQRLDIIDANGDHVCIACNDIKKYADHLDILDMSHETKKHEYIFSFFVSRDLFEFDRQVNFEFKFEVFYEAINGRRGLTEAGESSKIMFSVGDEENPPQTWSKETTRSHLRVRRATALAQAAQAEAAVAAQTEVKQAEESFSITDVETPFGGIDSRIVLGLAAVGFISLSYFAISRLLRKSSSTYTQIDEHEEI